MWLNDKMHNYLQSHCNGGPRTEGDSGATLLLILFQLKEKTLQFYM
jgi:hypothetical protein